MTHLIKKDSLRYWSCPINSTKTIKFPVAVAQTPRLMSVMEDGIPVHKADVTKD